MENFKFKIQKLFKTDTKAGQIGFAVVIIILYWALLVVAPLKVIYLFTNDGGWLVLYPLIMPFLFIIPYKIVKDTLKYGMLFWLFGFIVPYLWMIYYIYKLVVKAFGHFGF